MEEFIFSEHDYIFNVDWNNCKKTNFSSKLEDAWLIKQKKQLFRYELNITNSRVLEGKYGFYAQLNTDRAVSRRSPQEIKSLKEPFPSVGFNFTKVNKDELMFAISKQDDKSLIESSSSYFLINVSPLERYHCLLIPSLFKCLTQTITKESLILGVSSVLLNGSPEQRAGFNSLCGYASVNHLHFHTYYLSRPMKLETVELEHLIHRCYVLEKYPAKGFAFQICSKEELESTINDIYKLADFFTKNDVAHNLYITRGLTCEKAKSYFKTSKRDCVRIFVWARTSSHEAKSLDAFNPALCELFGHLVLKTSESFEKVDEETVSNVLQAITQGPYNEMKEYVKELYK